jgi:hypothetical protein
MEDLDGGVGDARFDSFADKPGRRRVVVLVDLDMIIEPELAQLPLGVDVGRSRQRLSAGRSIVASSSFRLAPILRITLALRSATTARIAVFSSTSPKN